MFSNSYQSGMHIELYNSQNKDLVKNWKFWGKIAKEYDASVKGYVNILNVGGVSKMNIPSNEKNSLGIVQSYIVFQIYLYSPKSFNIEIAISDTSKTKRRLMFSSSAKDIVINPLHSRIPLANIPIGIWVNLSIDVLSFVSECFKSQTFRSIDYVSITANCKVRRIFSMRNSLMEYERNTNEEFQIEYADVLPKNLTLPGNVLQENINLNIDRLRFIIETELKMSKENLINISNTNNHNQILSPSNKNEVFKSSNLNMKNKNINTPIIKNIRSKSVNKPLKNNNGELFNKQEFIESHKINYESNSKSPGDNSKNINNIKKNTIKNKNNLKIISPQNKNLKNKNLKENNHKINIIKSDDFSTNYNDNKSNILLNTLNYKNIEKWESSKDNMADSIEEIYEIDERRTLENIHTENDVKTNIKDKNDEKLKLEDSEEKFYYDIPIKDFKKKSIYKESGNFFNPKLTQQLKETLSEVNRGEDTKKKIIEEIFKDSQAIIEKERPYTPPFTKLVPFLKSNNSIIFEKEREEQMITASRDDNNSPGRDNKLYDSLEMANESKMADLIYDHVLGCYYDPKSNMYYELKN